MGKLSAEDEAALQALLDKQNSADDGEVWVKDGDREIRLTGGHAAAAFNRFFGDDQGAPAAKKTAPAKKTAAAKKTTAPAAGDEGDPGDEGDEGDEGDPAAGEQDPPAARKNWYFGGS